MGKKYTTDIISIGDHSLDAPGMVQIDALIADGLHSEAGYLTEESGTTRLTDAEIAEMGYIKTYTDTDTNTQLSDAQIAEMGYIKTYTDTDTNTQLTSAQIAEMGYTSNTGTVTTVGVTAGVGISVSIANGTTEPQITLTNTGYYFQGANTGYVGSGGMQNWNTQESTPNLNPNTNWFTSLRIGHGHPVDYYSNTLGIQMTGSDSGRIYTRTIAGGGKGTWKKYYHTGDFSTADVADGKTAHGWGNHADAGYLTSYTDTDTNTQLTSAEIAAMGYTGDQDLSSYHRSNGETYSKGSGNHMNLKHTTAGGYSEFSMSNDSDEKLVIGSIGSGYTSTAWAGSRYIYSTAGELRIKAATNLRLYSGGHAHTGNLAVTFDSNQEAVFTGRIQAGGGTSTEWNTAHGWGDHADEGYKTTDNNTQLTPAQVLTSIKAVDGSGSGLDADTVDGSHANLSYGAGKQYDFTINGDADTFYPVVIHGASNARMTRLTIFRGYSETAPSTWNTASHKGGLTLDMDVRFGGWGGYPNMMNVHDFGEIYSRICGGAAWTAHTMKFVVWLRGGGASYHIDSPSTTLSIEVNDSTSAENYVSTNTWYSYDHPTAAYDRTVVAKNLTEADTGANALLAYMPIRSNGNQNKVISGVDGLGYISSTGSMRAPYFYDSNDTSYYLDPASSSNLSTVTAQHFYGNLTGNASSATIAAAYLPLAGGTLTGDITVGSGNTSSNIYMADSDGTQRRIHTNSNRIGFLTSGNGWGAYCDNNGHWYSDYSMRAPIFYDSNNTGYYLNPVSGSNLHTVNANRFSASTNGSITIGDDSATYTYHDSSTRSKVYVSSSYPVITLNSTHGSNANHGPTLQFSHNGYDSNRQWVMGTGATGQKLDFGTAQPTNKNPHAGIAGYDGVTLMRMTVAGNVGIGGDWGYQGAIENPSYPLHVQGTAASTVDFRAPIFYDSNNTNYYVDAGSTTQLNHLSVNSTFKSRNFTAGSLGYQLENRNAGGATFRFDGDTFIFYGGGGVGNVFEMNQSGYAQASSSLRAPIFYDSDDTNYYVNPNTTTTALKIKGAIDVTSSHSGGNIALHYNYNNTDTYRGNMVMFMSEPGVTHDGGGIGCNIATNSPYYGRAINHGYGVYLRFDKTSGHFEFWNTQSTAGNSSGRGTRRFHGDASGNTFSSASSRAPIFYDTNNTGYYLNPASTSNLNVLTLAGTATASNFILSSDERKKTKIKDLPRNNINTNWKSFEMKNDEGEYRTGVIAQELEETHPEFVNTDPEGFKSVKYIDLLIAKIAELEARLEKLEK